jgi:hypothetical protein
MLVSLLHRGAMAGGALGRSRLVEENVLGIYQADFFVTSFATHVAVHTLQSKPGELVMIEKRRLPRVAVVAIDASGDASFCELFAVRIFMALFALLRSCLKVDVKKLRFEIRRLVTINARGAFVRTDQGEVRLGMIETG